MVIQFLITAGLTLTQTRELFGIPEEQLNGTGHRLKTQVVVMSNLAGRLLLVGRGQ